MLCWEIPTPLEVQQRIFSKSQALANLHFYAVASDLFQKGSDGRRYLDALEELSRHAAGRV